MDDIDQNPATHFDIYFASIGKKLKSPKGVASLSIEDRKFLFAVMIASVVPSDHKVKAVETDKLASILKQKYGLQGEVFTKAMIFARGEYASREDIKSLAIQLESLLSAEDRAELVGSMWDVALSDKELHQLEEQLIYSVADAAGLPRKRTAEQQARATQRM
jgi:uncharacterized tellurite resistance protein B-like protein